MERVLSTPELLLAIFSVADDDALLAAATVCQRWSPLALDCLWRDLKSVVPLLELVSPLTRQNSSDDWKFTQCPSTADWGRFDAYATRIRSIAFDDWAGEKNWAVTFKVIAESSLYHPRGAFFPPNVQRLSWGGVRYESAMAVLPFISRTIEHLHLRLSEDVREETAEKLLHCITQRQVNLKSFSLDTDIPPKDLSNSLVKLINNSRQLESIALPRYYQTQTIVEALGYLPQLKRLAVNYGVNQKYDSLGQALSFLPDRFLGLKAVEIDAPVPDITRLLSEFQQPTQLQHLTVSCAKLEKTGDVSDLVETIARRCPALQTLSFNFCSPNAPPSQVNLAFHSTFRPVLSCRSLYSFRIGFGRSIKMTVLDFQEMASAWPNLRVLVLCPNPRSGQSEGLSWNMLSVIATLFPHLEQLSTSFSSTDEVKFAGDILPKEEFQLLKKLDVGGSTVPNDKTALGFLIGAHCRLPVSISCDLSGWEGRWRSVEDVKNWQEVESIARRAAQVKQEMRKKWHLRGNDGDD